MLLLPPSSIVIRISNPTFPINFRVQLQFGQPYSTISCHRKEWLSARALTKMWVSKRPETTGVANWSYIIVNGLKWLVDSGS